MELDVDQCELVGFNTEMDEEETGREAHLERKGAGVPASEGERCIKAVEK